MNELDIDYWIWLVRLEGLLRTHVHYTFNRIEWNHRTNERIELNELNEFSI